MKDIMLLLLGLAEYLQVTLSDDQLKMYAEDLSDLRLEEVGESIKIFRFTQKENYGKFPLPAYLKSLVRPDVDNLDLARALTANILQSVSRFGYTNPDKAKEYLGVFGWRVVEKSGGWKSLCSRANDDTFSFIQAQIRDLAHSMYNLNKSADGLAIDHKKHYSGLLSELNSKS